MAKGIFTALNSPDLPEKAIVVHAKPKQRDGVAAGKYDFFEHLGAAAAERGYALILRELDPTYAPQAEMRQQKHIFFETIRGNVPFTGPNIFHAHASYIKGFWYLDRQGIYWNSSLVDMPFDAAAIDQDAATAFFDRVSRWRIHNNISLRAQPPMTELPPADVAIFLQDIELYANPLHYLTTKQMIRTAAGAVGGLCYVKPHPLMAPDYAAWLTKLCSRLGNAVVVQGSVHAIIRASSVIVSHNSAAGFEALMHRKPVLTCAKTDYAVASLVCRSPQDLRANIARAPAAFAQFPYEKYFYWFMGLNMLQPRAPDFAPRLRALLGIT